MKILKHAFNFCLRILTLFDFIPPLFARLTLAFVFLHSGFGKFNHLQKVTEFFMSLGIPHASLVAPFTATNELICGALLFVGFLTRLAVIPLIIIMFIALKTAKAEDIVDFNSLLGFPEYLYIVLLVWLVFAGAGKLSLDYFLVKKTKKS